MPRPYRPYYSTSESAASWRRFTVRYLQLSFQQAEQKDQVVPGKVPALLPAPSALRSGGGVGAGAPAAVAVVLGRLVIPLYSPGVIRWLPLSTAPLLRCSSPAHVRLLRQRPPGRTSILRAVAAGSHVPLPVGQRHRMTLSFELGDSVYYLAFILQFEFIPFMHFITLALVFLPSSFLFFMSPMSESWRRS